MHPTVRLFFFAIVAATALSGSGVATAQRARTADKLFIESAVENRDGTATLPI